MKNLLILAFAVLALPLMAQEAMNWKAHLKLADELYAKTLYADAAEQYEAAWRQKPKKNELIQKAAECYYIIKDYKKAIAAYQNIKDDYKNFPLAGLRYARCLKQDGNYDEASREFIDYLNKYEEGDKAIITEIVQNEIRGCELGIQLYSEETPTNVEIIHPGDNINSPETEFAPIPFNDDVLYFSSTVSSKAKIYFTMRNKAGEWKKAGPPKNFPDLPDQHYGNGTLTPDGKRFYFTICESEENWGGLTTRCEINVIKKIGDTWTTPQRLRDYINLAGSTTTHPYVIHREGKEILYFSSNREGSIGGMDLWSVERDVNSDDIDFTFPENLGPVINTLGDEITPYFDEQENVMYFSSNGHVSVGGMDIFKSVKRRNDWGTPENIGLPFNSMADDFYFVKMPSGNGGYLVSNRVFGMEKITTTHEDIFEYRYEETPAVVNNKPKTDVVEEKPIPTPNKDMADNTSKPKEKEVIPPAPKTVNLKLMGGVYDKNSDELVKSVKVSLYEVMDNGDKRLLTNQDFAGGRYEFAVLPNRTFVVEAVKDGYTNGTFRFTTNNESDVVEDLFIQKATRQEEVVDAGQEKQEEKPAPPTQKEPSIADATRDAQQAAIDKEKKDRKINTSPKNEEVVDNVTEPTIEEEETMMEEEEPTKTYSDNDKVISVPSSRSKEKELSPPNFEDYEDDYYIARGQSRADRVEFRTNAPRHQGDYYKIQIQAIDKFDKSSSRYDWVRKKGRLDSEYILNKGLTRVLVADFFTFDEAKILLREIQRNGFDRAFIVKYTNGERYGMIYR
ncbi:MAG: PD40 domain-containing protein [Saprospiraceae bacterium]|nr:PD40 domain-containing protein [Saprospiraceae bacterium]